MDKLENETWEEYAFKNMLVKITYTDKEQQIIDNISIPNPNIIDKRTCDWGYYMGCVYNFNLHNRLSFMDFIMHEIYTLRDKYKLGWYCEVIKSVENMTTEREEDINRQKWLFKELEFWEKKWHESLTLKMRVSGCYKTDKDKEKERIQGEMDKNRYLELKTIISETHKEQLDEFYSLIWKVRPILVKEEQQSEKQERIEIYQKYLKNKEIRLQISELEQKLIQLQGELIK